ncbi:hypothetical protein GCM10009678_13910 [Actinomadura kijaniata]
MLGGRARAALRVHPDLFTTLVTDLGDHTGSGPAGEEAIDRPPGPTGHLHPLSPVGQATSLSRKG